MSNLNKTGGQLSVCPLMQHTPTTGSICIYQFPCYSNVYTTRCKGPAGHAPARCDSCPASDTLLLVLQGVLMRRIACEASCRAPIGLTVKNTSVNRCTVGEVHGVRHELLHELGHELGHEPEHLLVLMSLDIAAPSRERAQVCPIPLPANFAGRNGCIRVTYTCDTHIYHECILYIYIHIYIYI